MVDKRKVKLSAKPALTHEGAYVILPYFCSDARAS